MRAAITAIELERLNFYRASELHGGLVLGRTGASVRAWPAGAPASRALGMTLRRVEVGRADDARQRGHLRQSQVHEDDLALHDFMRRRDQTMRETARRSRIRSPLTNRSPRYG